MKISTNIPLSKRTRLELQIFFYLTEAKSFSASPPVTQSLSNKFLFCSRVIPQYVSFKLFSSTEKVYIVLVFCTVDDMVNFVGGLLKIT